MVILCLLSKWNRKIKHEQIHHNSWNKCRSCCWGGTEQQFSLSVVTNLEHCKCSIVQDGIWDILQWAVVGDLSLAIRECSCYGQTMVMLVLLKSVSPSQAAFIFTVFGCSAVSCHAVWSVTGKGLSAGFWRETEKLWASYHLLKEIQSSATLLSEDPAAISWTAAPGHKMWLCGILWLGKR